MQYIVLSRLNGNKYIILCHLDIPIFSVRRNVALYKISINSKLHDKSKK